MPTAVVLLSGGLDSATVAAQAIAEGYDVIALSFRYGQRHVQELKSAQTVAEKLNIQEHVVVELNLAQWGGSVITNQISAAPSFASASGTTPTTYVPGRNTIFIAVALSLAEAKGAEAIFLGFTAADTLYPDTQPDYLEAFRHLAALSSKAGVNGNAPRLVAPLIQDDKTAIVRRALQLGVPIAATWSCYRAGTEPCGVCGPCKLRDRALIEVGRPDLATPQGRDHYAQEHAQEVERVTRLFWRFMLTG